ncbi:MAG: hypothetical protein WAT71_06220 [Ignavibacteria bacterium]
MEICKLCLSKNILVKKSHIFPEFLYKGMYDEKHTMFEFNPKYLLKENSKQKKVQSGIHEGSLLCFNCENLLSKYEHYANKVLFGGKRSDPEIPKFNNIKVNDSEFTHVTNIDYTKFKLFILSLVWRTSISSKPLFQEIDLGKYDEILRTMIVTNNPGNENDFPFLWMHFLKDNSFPQDALIIGQPSFEKFDDLTICKFLIRKFWIVCAIGVNINNIFFHEFTIKKSNELKLFSIPEGSATQFIMNHFGM